MLRAMGAALRRSVLIRRALKYGVVGAVANALLYIGYLGLTLGAGLVPPVATTIVYAVGIGLTYAGNALWAFGRSRSHSASAWRYVVTYGVGYVVQLCLLVFLVRGLSVPHPIAQLISMGSAAGTIFILLNYWVFRHLPPPDREA